MFNISSLLSSMDENDRNAFNVARASMQKTYLQAVSLFGGVNAMDQTDSWFMDAIDQRLAYLMERDGRTVPVILPTSEAVAATLPKASVAQLLKEPPTGSDAGNVPKDEIMSRLADLGKSTIAKAQGQAGAGTQPPGDDKPGETASDAEIAARAAAAANGGNT